VLEVGDWCDRHGVDAWYTQRGELAAATAPAHDGVWRSLVVSAERLGVRDRFVELSADEMAARVRLPHRAAGLLIPASATVQPARLARGLRRVVLEQGARIYEATPVRRLRPAPLAVAETSGGHVRAPVVVLAANAWMASLPQLQSRLAVRGSYIVLTEPAPERLADIGWTGGESLWNFRAAVNYVRTTADGRIAFGTGGMQPGFGMRVGPRFDWDRRLVAEVARQFRRMFPNFHGVRLEAAWGGPIDISGAHVVVVDTLPPGNVHVAAGYTGNGVGPCQLVGQILARRVLGIEDELTCLPIVGFRAKGFPPEPLRSLGALFVNEAVLRLNAAEDVGERIDPLTDFVARLPRRLGYNLGP
jgi:glycine/D-amino acid oxidase-like deaminating enzyme